MKATRAILVSWRQASRSRLPTHSPHAVRGAAAVSLPRRMIQCYYGILSNSRLEAAVPAHVTEKQMRCRSTLALTAAFVGGSIVLAPAQAPAQAPVVTRGGGVAGTGIGVGVGFNGKLLPQLLGTGHVGAGTNGIGNGVGNATGGVNGSPRAGTGGIADSASWGALTGGVTGAGRAIHSATGGLNDTTDFGQNTGGIQGTSIGSRIGGIGDLDSLGAGTGGAGEQTTPRFTPAR
jgi:hypothetical protein